MNVMISCAGTPDDYSNVSSLEKIIKRALTFGRIEVSNQEKKRQGHLILGQNQDDSGHSIIDEINKLKIYKVK